MGKASDKVKKALKEVKEERLAKLEDKLGLYYTMHSVLGVHWWNWLWCIGARGRGKSYSGVDTVLDFCKKYGQENVRCYYFRISDLSVKSMLLNKARKAIDAKLVRKYDLDITTKANTIYNRGKPLIDFYALVSAAKTGKGVAEYDPDFLNQYYKDGKKRFIFIIIDEFMMAEGVEKKSVGNPVEQFKIFIENILRDQEQLPYRAVMIMGFANSVSECNDFLAQLAGFIPETPGRYYLKRKHMIVDNIPNSKAYLEKRKKSIGADIMDYDNDANYTNVVKRDLESLMNKGRQLIRVTTLLKFSKDPKDWFCIYDGRYIRRYRGETVNKNLIVGMKRHLDNFFNPDIVKDVFEMYDARAYIYADLISQATFAAQLKLLKKQ